MGQLTMEKIWDEWYAPVASYIQASFCLQGENEDLMQEIMLKVHRSLGLYDRRHAFSTWLYSIARNTCLDWLARRRLTQIPLHQEPVGHFGTEQAVLQAEIEAAVNAVLAQHDETDRGIAWLAFYERLPYKEISRIHDLPLSTIKIRIHRLRTELKVRLEDYRA